MRNDSLSYKIDLILVENYIKSITRRKVFGSDVLSAELKTMFIFFENYDNETR